MQNVKTPRFYVDYLSFLNSNGGLSYDESQSDALGLNMFPFYRTTPTMAGAYPDFVFESAVNFGALLPNATGSNKIWVGIFGHNLKTENLKVKCYFNNTGAPTTKASITEVLNGEVSGDYAVPYMDGSTMFTISSPNTDLNEATHFCISFDDVGSTATVDTLRVGAIAMGVIWDAPHSPDMSLKLARLYDGVKIQQSIGGSKFATASYIRPNQAFEFGSPPYKNTRTGKRVWDMKFSYIGSSHLMADNELVSYGADLNGDGAIEANTDGTSPDYIHTTDSDGNNVLTSLDDYDFDSTPAFYSRVVHRTMGGMLPFIFQPDNSNNSPDQFAIARFNQNAFVYNQVAHNVYDVSLNIEEEC